MSEAAPPNPINGRLKIEWTNHLIAFVSSVLGIIIGLSLDQSIQKSAEAERRELFLLTVDAELDRNTAELDSVAAMAEDMSQLFLFLSNRYAGRFDLGGKDAGLFVSRYRISAHEYDSLKNRYADLIPDYESFGNGYWETSILSPDLRISPVSTAWHAFHSSESMRGFDIDKLILYSRAYEQLEDLKKAYSPDEDSTLLERFIFARQPESGKKSLQQIGQIYSRFTEQADKALTTIYRIRNKDYRRKSDVRTKAFGIS